MNCPRCRKGQVFLFDPRDVDPSCLACGHVIYRDQPLDIPPGQEPKRQWHDPVETAWRRQQQKQAYEVKRRPRLRATLREVDA